MKKNSRSIVYIIIAIIILLVLKGPFKIIPKQYGGSMYELEDTQPFGPVRKTIYDKRPRWVAWGHMPLAGEQRMPGKLLEPAYSLDDPNRPCDSVPPLRKKVDEFPLKEPDQRFYFENIARDNKCCPSTYSTSSSCVCWFPRRCDSWPRRNSKITPNS